jgi:hypothetical protein
MSGSFNTLLYKYNSLQTQLSLLEIQLRQYVTLNSIQTITSKKIFVVAPQSAQPIYPTDLANKAYVDSLILTPLNAVLIDGDQTLGNGVKTFTNLPQSSSIPSNPKDLVNKTYVDGIGDTIVFPQQLMTTNTQFHTPILPIGRYTVTIVFTFDFPTSNKLMNVNLVVANADADLFYHPPTQYTQHFKYSLSGIVSIDTSRPLIGVVEINSPMEYRINATFTYQSI